MILSSVDFVHHFFMSTLISGRYFYSFWTNRWYTESVLCVKWNAKCSKVFASPITAQCRLHSLLVLFFSLSYNKQLFIQNTKRFAAFWCSTIFFAWFAIFRLVRLSRFMVRLIRLARYVLFYGCYARWQTRYIIRFCTEFVYIFNHREPS